MTYTPADVPGFMGLDLADVEDARGAIEATDCYVHPDGRLVPRPGFSTSGSGGTVSDAATGSLVFQAYSYGPSPSVYPSPLLYPSGTAGGSASVLLVSGHKGDVQLWDATGTRLYLYNAVAGADWSFAALEGSAWGANGANTLIQSTVSTGITKPTCSTRAPTAQVGVFTSGRDMPKPSFVGVQTPDNRLVAAGFTTATGGPNGAATTAATIFFSQPDDPFKWDETEYEVIGDAGEPIIGLDNWADYLIVFKDRNWYVFYGNSVRSDGTGLALFNYRRIDAGCTVKSSAAGSKALYVLDSDGNIRATTGGIPQIIFNGDTTRYEPVRGQGFRAGDFIFLPAKRTDSDYLYPSSSESPSSSLYPSSAAGYLVYDEHNGTVFFWTIGLTAGAAFGNSALFANGTGVATFPSGTTDDATAVSATYASPYSSWGSPGVEKSVRQTFFHGEGTVNVQWARDLQSYNFARSVTMLRGRGIDRNAVRGETLSYRITGSDFKLNRLVPMLREQRSVGVRS